MLFLFNLTYAASWGTIAFLIPTEVWPSNMRAQGNGFGITGWTIGVGWTVLGWTVLVNLSCLDIWRTATSSSLPV
jgi:hypothetical protein